MQKTVDVFEKNTREEIRSTLTEYRGKHLADVRVFFQPNTGTERLPSKKGLTIAVDKLPELRAAIGKLEDAVALARAAGELPSSTAA